MNSKILKNTEDTTNAIRLTVPGLCWKTNKGLIRDYKLGYTYGFNINLQSH